MKNKLFLNRQEGVSLIRTYYQIQKHRVGLGNQVFAIISDKIRELMDDPEFDLPQGLEDLLKFRDEEMEGIKTQLEIYWQSLYETEKQISKDLLYSIRDTEIYQQFLLPVKGIGPVLGANLIYHIDISKSLYVSSLWKYAGLGVNDKGAADKLTKGEKATWNPDLKRACFLIGQSFIKAGSQYRQFFDSRREREHVINLKRPEKEKLTDGHIARRATRYMVKQFLSDLYVHWRQIEGLPVNRPWITEYKQGHDLREPINLQP